MLNLLNFCRWLILVFAHLLPSFHFLQLSLCGFFWQIVLYQCGYELCGQLPGVLHAWKMCTNAQYLGMLNLCHVFSQILSLVVVFAVENNPMCQWSVGCIWRDLLIRNFACGKLFLSIFSSAQLHHLVGPGCFVKLDFWRCSGWYFSIRLSCWSYVGVSSRTCFIIFHACSFVWHFLFL